MRVSILDQSPISEGSTGADALRNTLDLAELADELGYHRYWVAEHHGSPMLAGASPETLIAAIAARTQRLRVGSGGVMLPHYSPFKVAESFTVLAALYPERIDLGVGRAAGTDQLTAFALQRDRRQTGPDNFPEQLAELLAYLEDRLADGHPFKRLSSTLPGRPYIPETWLLGSSAQSAVWAAQLALPYAFADFINPAGAEITAMYRRRYAEQHGDSQPTTAVAAWVVCAETDEQADYLATSSRMTLRLLRRGRLTPVPAPETAIAYLRSENAPVSGLLPRRRGIIGSPAKVRAELLALAEEYGAQELIVVTITYDHGARRRSYELVADAMRLPSRAAPR